MPESLQGLHSVLLLDQQDRWRSGDRPMVESYLQLIPELGSDLGKLLDLVYQEIVFREQSGERPTLEEYCTRFPQLKDDLKLQFEVHSGLDWRGVNPTSVEDDTTYPSIDGLRMEHELGRGSYGRVFRAWQADLKRWVAVKVIGESFSADGHGSTESSGFREAQSIARLTHPGIVPVYSVGRCDGGVYFVQELVEDGTLSDWIRGHAISCRQAASLLVDLAQAVHYAHLCGVIHCDLKPSNVLVRKSDTGPSLKISDFGLARSFDADSRVASNHLAGTLQYMAPEQTGIEGAEITPATDVYGLGAILYELLTGQPPFSDISKLRLFLQVRHDLPNSPKASRPSIDDDLSVICMKCLSKSPSDRYGNTAELAADLERYLGGFAPLASNTGPLGRFRRWTKRNPLSASLMAAIVIITCISFVSVTSKMMQAQLAERREHERANELDAALYRNQFRLAYLAWQAGDVARTEKILTQTNPVHRSWEWFYLDSICRSSAPQLTGFTHTVNQLASSPNSRLFVANDVNHLSIMDRHSDDEPMPVDLAETVLMCPPRFSDDGESLLTGVTKDGKCWVQIRNISTGEVSKEIGPARGNLFACSLSSDGMQLLTSSWVDSLQLVTDSAANWSNAQDYSERMITAFGVRSISLQNRLTIERWDTQTGKRIGGILGSELETRGESPGGRIDSTNKLLAWFPRTFVPGKGNNQAYLVDLSSGKLLYTLKGHQKPISGLRFSPDSSLVATFGEEGCFVWSTADGNLVRKHKMHIGSVLSADFSPDGQFLATGGQDFLVRLWNVASGTEVKQLRGASTMVVAVAFSRDGQSLVGADQNQAVLEWDVGGQKNLCWESPSAVTRISFDEAGEHLSVSLLSGKLEMLSLQNAGGEPRSQPQRLSDDCLEFAYSRTANKIAMIHGSDGRVETVSLGDIGKTFRDRNASDLPKATATGRAPICWTADGKQMAFISKDKKSIHICDASSLKLQLQIAENELTFSSIACGENDLLAATCSDDCIRVWNRTDGKLVQKMKTDWLPIQVAFRPQSHDLAVAFQQSQNGEIWDWKLGKRRLSIEGHKLWITCLAYSPDGLRLLTGGEDQSLRAWDAQSGEELLTSEFNFPIKAIAVSANGKLVAVAGGRDLSSGTVSILGISVRSNLQKR